MSFLRPELLLLLVPLLWLVWRTRDTGRTTTVLRITVVLLFVAAAAGLHLALRAEGRDLVVVVDRSRSMPPGSEEFALEVVRLAEDARRAGDRVGVVSFGSGATIDRLPSAGTGFQGFAGLVGGDASDLGRALETALELLDASRPGGLVVVSDGESNGRDPLAVARRVAQRGARIDVHPLERPASPDVAVLSVDLPVRVDAGEPFQFTARVLADEAETRRFVLERDGELVRRGERRFEAGETVLVFRDIVDAPGVGTYRLRLEGGADRVPENDRGLGAVFVAGPRGVLVVNHDGREDTLSSLLRRAGFPVRVAAPELASMDPVALSAHRVVVLENVRAGRLADMEALAEFVVERGGGLLMTGGQASFGLGGYHLSPVDDVLPVSMEMREEHRKQGLALVMALDRSGSMSATVPSGETKMELANAGAVAAIELLGSIDAVVVLAVDTAPAVVVESGSVEDGSALAGRVHGIRPGGGGINTLTALRAAASKLDVATQANRHVLIFADASDADEQAGCADLVDTLAAAGVTLSVIALGVETDVHAAFLVDLAARGGGEAYFSTDPLDLPRLFAEDTLKVARSSFVEAPTASEVLPELRGLGDLGFDEFPTVAGYNLTYLRPEAACGVLTRDEFDAPLFAFGQRGLGRSAAYTGQIGGTFGADVVAWPEFGAFFATVTRWCAGLEEPNDVFVEARRSGAEAVVSVTLDPSQLSRVDLARLGLRLGAPGDEWRDVLLERVSEDRFEARWSLTRPGVTLGTVHLGEGRFAQVPPLTLPYSPEFTPESEPRRGQRVLRELADETRGLVAPVAEDLFRGERFSVRYRPLAWELALAGLVLMVLEIAGRRLQLWSSVRLPRRRSAEERRAERERKDKVAAAVELERAEEAAGDGADAPAERARPVSARAQTADMADALAEARRRAGRRTGR